MPRERNDLHDYEDAFQIAEVEPDPDRDEFDHLDHQDSIMANIGRDVAPVTTAEAWAAANRCRVCGGEGCRAALHSVNEIFSIGMSNNKINRTSEELK